MEVNQAKGLIEEFDICICVLRICFQADGGGGGLLKEQQGYVWRQVLSDSFGWL